jgi:hypothetical protein
MVMGGKIGKAMPGGGTHAKPGLLQPDREGNVWLHVAARTVGEEGDCCCQWLIAGACRR